jgi:hypothetical protein
MQQGRTLFPRSSTGTQAVRTGKAVAVPGSVVVRTLPLGSVGFEVEAIEGERYVWLAPNVVNRLRALRRPGEGYSDAILGLVASAGSGMQGTRAR